ncbi:MAG: peptidylprolyl isomerase [Anaerolineae bacterium]|nr:peptidylprolyl isomerase [Anaerolineae bacterium]
MRLWTRPLAIAVLAWGALAWLCVSCTPARPEVTPPPAAGPTVEALYTIPTAGSTVPSAQETATPSLPAEAVALVNGEPVPRDAYEKQVAQFAAALQAQGVDISTAEGQARLQEVRRQVLEAMIDQVLIAQGAAEAGIAVSDEEVQAHVERSIAEGGGRERFAQWLQANNLTEEEFRENVRAQLLTDVLIQHLTQDLPQKTPQVHLRQILVSDEALAQELRQRIAQGESFEALAKEFSEDESTRQQGGDLGWFPQGLSLLAPEVENAAFALEPGQVSEVVQTSYGYYILIQVVERDADRALSPEMQQALRQQKFLEWLSAQREEATIVRAAE